MSISYNQSYDTYLKIGIIEIPSVSVISTMNYHFFEFSISISDLCRSLIWFLTSSNKLSNFSIYIHDADLRSASRTRLIVSKLHATRIPSVVSEKRMFLKLALKLQNYPPLVSASKNHKSVNRSPTMISYMIRQFIE